MTHQEIIAYARKRGLKNARLEHQPYAGWWLKGTGRDKRDWPLSWKICRELDMSCGCGNSEEHQCRPEEARLPKKTRRKQ